MGWQVDKSVGEGRQVSGQIGNTNFSTEAHVPLRSMASTLRMRTTISLRQWQSWKGIWSSFRLTSMTQPQAGGLTYDYRPRTPLSASSTMDKWLLLVENRKIVLPRHVYEDGDQKNWPVCPKFCRQVGGWVGGQWIRQVEGRQLCKNKKIKGMCRICFRLTFLLLFLSIACYKPMIRSRSNVTRNGTRTAEKCDSSPTLLQSVFLASGHVLL